MTHNICIFLVLPELCTRNRVQTCGGFNRKSLYSAYATRACMYSTYSRACWKFKAVGRLPNRPMCGCIAAQRTLANRASIYKAEAGRRGTQRLVFHFAISKTATRRGATISLRNFKLFARANERDDSLIAAYLVYVVSGWKKYSCNIHSYAAEERRTRDKRLFWRATDIVEKKIHDCHYISRYYFRFNISPVSYVIDYIHESANYIPWC